MKTGNILGSPPETGIHWHDNFGLEEIPSNAEETSREAAELKLAQGVSPGLVEDKNPEPASAGDTLFIRSHPVRNGSGRGWGTRRLHNLGAAIYGQLTTPLFSGSG